MEMSRPVERGRVIAPWILRDTRGSHATPLDGAMAATFSSLASAAVVSVAACEDTLQFHPAADLAGVHPATTPASVPEGSIRRYALERNPCGRRPSCTASVPLPVVAFEQLNEQRTGVLRMLLIVRCAVTDLVRHCNISSTCGQTTNNSATGGKLQHAQFTGRAADCAGLSDLMTGTIR